jgi:hypothetical protein
MQKKKKKIPKNQENNEIKGRDLINEQRQCFGVVSMGKIRGPLFKIMKLQYFYSKKKFQNINS